jgi:hypothetical protein
MSQIGVYFHSESMNQQQYKDILKRLETAGAGSPKGRLYHSCFGEGDKLMVFDVWESQATFDAFGQTLMPILSDVGVDPGTPDIMPMVNTITGK